MDTTSGLDCGMQPSPVKPEVSGYVLAAGILLLVASVSLNVVLARKVQSFRHIQSSISAERLVKVGTAVPSIPAKRLDGQPAVISFQGTTQPTVLYIFTPTCIWCARNLSNLKTLVANESGRYRFIGLSLSGDGVSQYVTKNALGIPVYSGMSSAVLKTYKLGSTPQTIVISSEGHVLQNWVGAYVGPQKSQVEAFFHTALPGLITVPEATTATNQGN
jgi:peroxiredoxin